jgi:hypothetical protein
MIIAIENQWLAEITGGPDKMEVFGRALGLVEQSAESETTDV